MRNYRRPFVPGGTFFFTLVTADRLPIFTDPSARTLLRDAITACRKTRPIEQLAFVLLPDHLHALWRLPNSDTAFSTRWSQIKSHFTREWRKRRGIEASTTAAQHQRRHRGVWQTRFWDHVIRDESDYVRHVDYIHFNPVKHALTDCPHGWQWSSFHDWVANDYYDADWCCSCNQRIVRPPDFAWADAFELE